jgi:hypothetical protein
MATTEPHCTTCVCGRRARVQGEYRQRPPGTVAWWEHERAWAAYAARFGTSQSAEVIVQRGGFGYAEMTALLGHEPETWSVRG